MKYAAGKRCNWPAGLMLSAAQNFAAVGTHSKWLRVDRQQQQVTRLQTLMTGELYALLLNHSVLGKGLPEQCWSHQAFLSGIENGAEYSASANRFD
jgi:2-dehydro-3-deoxygalactonokinase